MSSFTYQKSFVVTVTATSSLDKLDNSWMLMVSNFIRENVSVNQLCDGVVVSIHAGREEKLDKERLLQQVQTAIKQAFKNFE